MTVTFSDTSSTPARNDGDCLRAVCGSPAASAPPAASIRSARRALPARRADSASAEAAPESADHGRSCSRSATTGVPRTVRPGLAAETVTCSGGISDCGRA